MCDLEAPMDDDDHPPSPVLVGKQWVFPDSVEQFRKCVAENDFSSLRTLNFPNKRSLGSDERRIPPHNYLKDQVNKVRTNTCADLKGVPSPIKHPKPGTSKQNFTMEEFNAKHIADIKDTLQKDCARKIQVKRGLDKDHNLDFMSGNLDASKRVKLTSPSKKSLLIKYRDSLESDDDDDDTASCSSETVGNKPPTQIKNILPINKTNNILYSIMNKPQKQCIHSGVVMNDLCKSVHKLDEVDKYAREQNPVKVNQVKRKFIVAKKVRENSVSPKTIKKLLPNSFRIVSKEPENRMINVKLKSQIGNNSKILLTENSSEKLTGEKQEKVNPTDDNKQQPLPTDQMNKLQELGEKTAHTLALLNDSFADYNIPYSEIDNRAIELSKKRIEEESSSDEVVVKKRKSSQNKIISIKKKTSRKPDVVQPNVYEGDYYPSFDDDDWEGNESDSASNKNDFRPFYLPEESKGNNSCIANIEGIKIHDWSTDNEVEKFKENCSVIEHQDEIINDVKSVPLDKQNSTDKTPPKIKKSENDFEKIDKVLAESMRKLKESCEKLSDSLKKSYLGSSNTQVSKSNEEKRVNKVLFQEPSEQPNEGKVDTVSFQEPSEEPLEGNELPDPSYRPKFLDLINAAFSQKQDEKVEKGIQEEWKYDADEEDNDFYDTSDDEDQKENKPDYIPFDDKINSSQFPNSDSNIPSKSDNSAYAHEIMTAKVKHNHLNIDKSDWKHLKKKGYCCFSTANKPDCKFNNNTANCNDNVNKVIKFKGSTEHLLKNQQNSNRRKTTSRKKLDISKLKVTKHDKLPPITGNVSLDKCHQRLARAGRAAGHFSVISYGRQIDNEKSEHQNEMETAEKYQVEQLIQGCRSDEKSAILLNEIQTDQSENSSMDIDINKSSQDDESNLQNDGPHDSNGKFNSIPTTEIKFETNENSSTNIEEKGFNKITSMFQNEFSSNKENPLETGLEENITNTEQNTANLSGESSNDKVTTIASELLETSIVDFMNINEDVEQDSSKFQNTNQMTEAFSKCETLKTNHHSEKGETYSYQQQIRECIKCTDDLDETENTPVLYNIDDPTKRMVDKLTTTKTVGPDVCEPLKVSKEYLRKEKISKPHFKPPPSGGFASASGKLLKISKNSLEKVKFIFKDEFAKESDKSCLESEKQYCKILKVQKSSKTPEQIIKCSLSSNNIHKINNEVRKIEFLSAGGKQIHERKHDSNEQVRIIKHIKLDSLSNEICSAAEKHIPVLHSDTEKAKLILKDEFSSKSSINLTPSDGKQFLVSKENFERVQLICKDQSNEEKSKNILQNIEQAFKDLAELTSASGIPMKQPNNSLEKARLNDIHEVGFSSGGDKQLHTMNDASERSDRKYSAGFSSAGGIPLQLSNAVLERAENIFKNELAEEMDDNFQTDSGSVGHSSSGDEQLQTPKEASEQSGRTCNTGFSSAASKPLQLSNPDLGKSKNMFKNEFAEDMEDNCQTHDNRFVGLSSAGNEQLQISKEAPERCDKKHSAGFSSAGGKPLQISNAALERAKNMFKNELAEDMEENYQTNASRAVGFSSAGDKLQTSKEASERFDKKYSAGFSSAGGKPLQISNAALERAKNMFKNELADDMKENFQTNASRAVGFSSAGNKQPQTSKEASERSDKKYSAGFSSAGGKPLQSSNAAFEKAKNMFKNELAEDMEENFQTNASRAVGFSSAGDKQPQTSKEASDRSDKKYSAGFSSAGGKPLQSSEAALERAKSMFKNGFAEDMEENFQTNASRAVGFSSAGDKQPQTSKEASERSDKKYSAGFSSAGGKPFQSSNAAFEKAKNMFKNELAEDMEENFQTNASRAVGFSSAGDKQPQTSKEASDRSDKKYSAGFSSAGGKPLQSSEAALERAKSMFKNEFAEDMEENFQTNASRAVGFFSAGDKQPQTSKEASERSDKKYSAGFSSAGGKPLQLSNAALERAKSMFKNEFAEDMEENFQTNASRAVSFSSAGNKQPQTSREASESSDKKYSAGFSSAGGKSLQSSNAAFEKAKNVFKNELAEDMEENFQTNASRAVGFSSAGDKQPQTSKEASERSDKKNSAGFSSAGGKPLQLSNAAFEKAKNMFKNELAEDMEENTLTNASRAVGLSSAGNKQPQTSREASERSDKKHSAGFSSAGGKPQQLSNAALERAENMFKNELAEDMEDNFQTNDSRPVGFSSASDKQPQTSNDATEKYDQKYSGGFSSAGGKPLQLSNAALERAKNMFKNELAEDMDDNFQTNDSRAVGFSSASDKQPQTSNDATEKYDQKYSGGFSSAGGKPLQLSNAALERAKNMFKNELAADMGDNFETNDSHAVGFSLAGDKIQTSKEASERSDKKYSAGFSSAGGKPQQLSNAALERAKNMFKNELAEDMEDNFQTNDRAVGFSSAGGKLQTSKAASERSDKKYSAGFSSAGGKPQQLSNTALERAKNMFKNELAEDIEENIQTNASRAVGFSSAGDKQPQTSKEASDRSDKKYSAGFSSAGGKPLQSSEAALERAKSMFKNELAEDMEENFQTNASRAVGFSSAGDKQPQKLKEASERSDKKYSAGFSSAGGKPQQLSNAALERAKNMFKNELAEDMEENFQTNASRAVGFSSAGDKQPQTSKEASDRSDKKYSAGFSSAPGKPLQSSEAALERAKNMFKNELAEDMEDNFQTNDSRAVGFSSTGDKQPQTPKEASEKSDTKYSAGFSSAVGKPLQLSNAALERAKNVFKNELAEDMDDNFQIRDHRADVFSPAGDKQHQTPRKPLEKANRKYNVGLSSASGKPKNQFREVLKKPKTLNDIDCKVAFSSSAHPIKMPENTLNKDSSEFSQTNSKPMSIKMEVDDIEIIPSEKLEDNGKVSAKTETDPDKIDSLLNEDLAVFDSKDLVSPPIKHSSQSKISMSVCNNFNSVLEDNNLSKIADVFDEDFTLSEEIKREHQSIKLELPNAKIVPKESDKTIKAPFDYDLETNFTYSQAKVLFELTDNVSAFLDHEKADVMQIDSNNSAEVEQLNDTYESGNNQCAINVIKCKSQPSSHQPASQSIGASRNNSSALKRQEERILAKTSNTVIPQKGLLTSMKENVKLTPLNVGLGKISRPPVSSLLELGVKEEIAFLTPGNALNFKFTRLRKKDNSDFEIVLKDGSIVVINNNGEVGIEEIQKSFLACPGVDPNLISMDWIKNHYKWIVWKLASYDRSFPHIFEGRCLTVENLFLQLKLRYDREIDSTQRSAFKKILENDEPSVRRFICCVSSIIKMDLDKGDVPFEVELTDGWYGIRTIIDIEMASQIKKGKVKIGTKLLVQGAEILNCEQGCDPLKVPENVRLKIHSNASRRVKWYAKMGFTKNPGPIKTSISSILPSGGFIWLTSAIVARIYPCLHMSKDTEGKTVFRNHRSEYLEMVKSEKVCTENVESLYEEVWKEVEKKFNEKISLKNVNLKKVKKIDDPELLFNIMKKTNDESLFTKEQLKLIKLYNDQWVTKMKSEVQDVMQKRMKDIRPNRIVTQLVKAKLVDDSTGSQFTLTIWRPSEELLSFLAENKIYDFYSLNAVGVRDRVIQLSNSRHSRYEFNRLEVGNKYARQVTKLSEFKKENFNPLFGEVDIVGVVAYVNKPDQPHGVTRVFVCDLDSNYVAIAFWTSLAKFGFEDILEEGTLVVASNLQWRVGSKCSKIPCIYATEMSDFSRNPKQLYFKQEITEFNLFSIEKSLKEFAVGEKDKILNLIKPSDFSNSPMSVSRTTAVSMLSHGHTDDSCLTPVQKRLKKFTQFSTPPPPLGPPLPSTLKTRNICKEFVSPLRKNKH